MVLCLFSNGLGSDAGLRGPLHVGDAALGDQADPGKQPGCVARLRWQPDWLLLAAGQRNSQFGRLGRLCCLGPDRHRRPDRGLFSRSFANAPNFGEDREGRDGQRSVARGSLVDRRPPQRCRHDLLIDRDAENHEAITTRLNFFRRESARIRTFAHRIAPALAIERAPEVTRIDRAAQRALPAE